MKEEGKIFGRGKQERVVKITNRWEDEKINKYKQVKSVNEENELNNTPHIAAVS